jgi:hypothetical protein
VSEQATLETSNHSSRAFGEVAPIWQTVDLMMASTTTTTTATQVDVDRSPRDPTSLRRQLGHDLARLGVSHQTTCREVRISRGDHSWYDFDPGAAFLCQGDHDLLIAMDSPLAADPPGSAIDALRVLVHEHLHGAGPRLENRPPSCDRCVEDLIWGPGVERAREDGAVILATLHELDTELATREYLRLRYLRPLDHASGSYECLLLSAAHEVADATATDPSVALAGLAQAAFAAKGLGGRMGRAAYLLKIAALTAAQLSPGRDLAIVQALAHGTRQLHPEVRVAVPVAPVSTLADRVQP